MVHTFAGSQEVFIAAEALCEAFQQSAALVTQCCDTGDAGIWAMEDSIEFQSVGLELLNAVTVLAKSDIPLPPDVREDILHVRHQLQKLQFTEEELEESENAELEAVREKTLTLSTSDPRIKQKFEEEQHEEIGESGQGALPREETHQEGRKEEKKGDTEDQQQHHDDVQLQQQSTPIPSPMGQSQYSIAQNTTDKDDSEGEEWEDAHEESIQGDHQEVTALPPGHHHKGTMGRGGSQVLPQDPFNQENHEKEREKNDEIQPMREDWGPGG